MIEDNFFQQESSSSNVIVTDRSKHRKHSIGSGGIELLKYAAISIEKENRFDSADEILTTMTMMKTGSEQTSRTAAIKPISTVPISLPSETCKNSTNKIVDGLFLLKNAALFMINHDRLVCQSFTATPSFESSLTDAIGSEIEICNVEQHEITTKLSSNLVEQKPQKLRRFDVPDVSEIAESTTKKIREIKESSSSDPLSLKIVIPSLYNDHVYTKSFEISDKNHDHHLQLKHISSSSSHFSSIPTHKSTSSRIIHERRKIRRKLEI